MTRDLADWASYPRIGLGTDLHRLVQGRPCVLGGVVFADCPVGPDGHSDGDAVLHAITDALLGAAGLDDLGTLFPNDAATNLGRASQDFVLEARRQVAERGLHLVSLDVVVHCDRPKISQRRDALRSKIAELCGLPPDRVNIKGKTYEATRDAATEVVSVTAVALLIALRSGA